MSPDSLAADDRIVRAHIADAEAAPLLIEVTRGDMVESVHRGIVSVVNADGKDVLALGDVNRPTYPRSAIKPLQTLPVIESGAADAFNLSDAEIALCCASHAGEPIHTEKVVPWLGRLGLSVDDLECGPQLPYSQSAAHALIKAGTEPTRAHNNCSGKHSGMLTTAVHLGEPTKGYTGADHPVQTRLIELIGEMGEMDLSQTARGVDGCGIPVFGAPLRGIAYAMARFAAPDKLGAERAAACRRIAKACAANPLMLSGTGSFNSVVLAETGETCLLKGGAEGYYTASIPAKGYGVAIKIDDGAGRASQAAVLAVLVHLGVIDAVQKSRIEAACSQEVRNWAGRLVGVIRPTPAF
ncbi:asparaginase [Nisaea acidiphila]|uniref:Asparaginase n=1 Tax=Nisaea acidiphila TaxID=1862145 RepID=A0A9J7AP02_9PROT|nr:asparaginase [Nisaea acidiphila]UUX48321.1 asparaginase [Nisaea acidiphila]